MYFPIGWPKVLSFPNRSNFSVRHIVSNRERIFFAILTDDSVFIFYCKPCVLIVFDRRTESSLNEFGTNELAEWKPDSSFLIVSTSKGCLLLYKIILDSDQKGLYEQIDPVQPNLRRDSAELFIKEVIPALQLTFEKHVYIDGKVKGITCIRDELMVASSTCQILRYRWDLSLNRDYCVDLRRVPFCLDQQVSKAIPIVEKNSFIVHIEYSPLIGGFSIVFNDGRAAFLTASSLKFDPNQMQGIWAPEIDDATCACVNHKFRLITFGRRNSQGVVYSVDESTGGLVVSHKLVVPGQVFPGPIGPVLCAKWSPDSCALAIAWATGGFSLWSTYGALLMCSLGWDYGITVDLTTNNPLVVRSLEWSAEGYQLWMVKTSVETVDQVIQLGFVKSALTVNPCMSHQNHLYLQGEDRLYVDLGVGLSQVGTGRESPVFFKSALDSKQWVIIQIPSAYSATNWPIRYTAIDSKSGKLAVAGKTGLAHYSLVSHKWKLFGNESQERDLLVTGGLLWWRDHVVAGCYNIPQDEDEVRLYPASQRLSNIHMTVLKLPSQSLLLDCLNDRLLVFCSDVRITIYGLSESSGDRTGPSVDATKIQIIDMSALSVHPICFVSITLTTLRTEPSPAQPTYRDNFIINVSGRLLMVNQTDVTSQVLGAPTVLASSVENVWSPSKFCKAKPHLTEALWLFCGSHGMRVWLPLFPREGDSAHTFMSKRIMLPFQLKIYPLAILFEEAILLGVDNDTVLYTSDSNSPFSLPFCVLERTSQVYLHQILRQLIRRNLGFHAWEIARGCTSLPYFPHSLELLLHEVLEEEATSKEPIPDAQLPSVIEFIQEFPLYLETVVQCARKTEIALWPYLFSVAGKPKELFQKCLASNQLETATSYLIILQNLESSSVSRQFATMLLDSTLTHAKWDLSKELVRFLKAIDPNDVENMRAPLVMGSKYGIPQTPPVAGDEEDLSLYLGTLQVSRSRSYSTTNTPKITAPSGPQSRTSVSDIPGARRKKSEPVSKSEGGSAEEFFMDVMVERHARRLLSHGRLSDLGKMAAALDFPLVRWLARERGRAAVVQDPIGALKNLHEDFSWPYPCLTADQSAALEKESLNEGTPLSAVDSGYTSYQGIGIEGPAPDGSVASEPESWVEDEGWAGQNQAWSELPPPQLLDQLARLASRGPPKAEIQLRYLLQLLLDAGCLQWALLVSLLLRDALAVHRLAHAARSPDQGHFAVISLISDINTLCQWSLAECPGYKPFMLAIQPQLLLLNKLLASKATPAVPRSRTPSASCEVVSPAPSPPPVPAPPPVRPPSPAPSLTVHLQEQPSSCAVS